MARGWAFGILGAILLGWARVASAADPPSAVLEFSGGAACLSEGEFRRQVAERMGYDPFRASAPRVLSIRVGGRGPYRGELLLRGSLGDEIGRRALEDADCEALRDALVLAVTLGIDPLAAMPKPSSPPKETAPPVILLERPAAPSPTLPVTEEADRGLPTRPSPPLLLRASVGAQLFAGLTPGDVPGPSGSIGLRYGRFGLDVEGVTTLSGSSRTSAGGAEATATVGTLLPCYRVLVSGGFGADLCGELTGGALFSRGTDVSRAGSRTDPLVLAGLRLAGEWRFSRVLGVALFLQGSIPFEHDELTVDVAGAPAVVWKTPAASATGGLSMFALFP